MVLCAVVFGAVGCKGLALRAPCNSMAKTIAYNVSSAYASRIGEHTLNLKYELKNLNILRVGNYTLYFECKHKFGSRKVEAENLKEAKLKAEPMIKNGVWCDNRCNNCKLKITR